MPEPPSVLNIHTPTSSFAIVHSLTQETLLNLYDKLSRKHNTDYYGQRVGPGWLKYEHNGGIWNLDDDSDYTIFAWRHQQQQSQTQDVPERPAPSVDSSPALSYLSVTSLGPNGHSTKPTAPIASSSKLQLTNIPSSNRRNASPNTGTAASSSTPTLHLADPSKTLPAPPAYLNPCYYAFHPANTSSSNGSTRKGGVTRVASSSNGPSRVPSRASSTRKSGKGSHNSGLGGGIDEEGPKFKKEFDKFHSENGVRTVIGSIGPVQNVRMLLKVGYRHVYISRKFAIKHGFIPRDASPGNYGYGGLVNIGTWPITLVPSSTQPSSHLGVPGFGLGRSSSTSLKNTSTIIPSSTHPPHHSTPKRSQQQQQQQQHSRPSPSSNTTSPSSRPPTGHTVTVQVYLSEEPHFDVVLGRSFFEKRQVKTSSIDPTDVVCLDTGEKIECELVILKDGRGEIVTVT